MCVCVYANIHIYICTAGFIPAYTGISDRMKKVFGCAILKLAFAAFWRYSERSQLKSERAETAGFQFGRRNAA